MDRDRTGHSLTLSQGEHGEARVSRLLPDYDSEYECMSMTVCEADTLFFFDSDDYQHTI